MKSVFRHILEILKISLIRMKSLQEILIELLNIVETKIYTTPPHPLLLQGLMCTSALNPSARTLTII